MPVDRLVHPSVCPSVIFCSICNKSNYPTALRLSRSRIVRVTFTRCYAKHFFSEHLRLFPSRCISLRTLWRLFICKVNSRTMVIAPLSTYAFGVLKNKLERSCFGYNNVNSAWRAVGRQELSALDKI